MMTNRCKIHGTRLILDPPNDPYCEDCEGGVEPTLTAPAVKEMIRRQERLADALRRHYQSPSQFTSQQHRRDTMGQGDRP